jgi:hypothetical protein
MQYKVFKIYVRENNILKCKTRRNTEGRECLLSEEFSRRFPIEFNIELLQVKRIRVYQTDVNDI